MIKSLNFNPDHQQRQVIDFIGGEALVLAAPGCGKTDVLAYRIIKAHRDYGVPYSDMLCLTFTNRASREMQQRVRDRIDEPTSGLFVGNLHRFCMRFLFDNNLIKLDTSIIDEDDQTEIINDLREGDDRYRLSAAQIRRITAHANEISKRRMGFPPDLVTFGKSEYVAHGSIEEEFVEKYLRYKNGNFLIDYDDIINLTYRALMRQDYKKYKYSNYRWMQVDEIQDLNPLQMAIISKLIDPAEHTVLYLGDERQSIFSFIGASLDSLNALKSRLKIFTFSTNYRSPKYLVDFINKYAESNLGVTKAELPTASLDKPDPGGLLLLETHDSYSTEQEALIAAQTRQISLSGMEESVGILTRTNARIENIAKLLDEHHLKYLKLSNRDRFKMVDYKTIYSHLAVVANEHRSAEWSRILYQTKTVPKLRTAHKLMSLLRKAGLSATDMLRDDGSSYMIEFHKALETGTFVVFDTETTGLNLFDDDVIQISAVKLNAAGIIQGSDFDVIIRTDRQIPDVMNDNTENPMLSIYAKADKLEFADALNAFIDYVGDCILIGHNCDFDIHILLNNIRRRMPCAPVDTRCFSRYYDSLKLARLFEPKLKSHKLADLITRYGIEGKNTHYALDDAHATARLISFLYAEATSLLHRQLEVLAKPEIRKVIRRLRARYKDYYDHTRQKLFSPEVCEDNTLTAEIEWLYANLIDDGYINPIPQFDYIVELFRKVMVDTEKEPYFYQQLINHVYEMRTFSESDLYHNGVVKENIHIMTIHKAKGLQFDNVFVYAVNEIPSYMDRDSRQSMQEAARLLYVAISRAKRRLFLCYNHKCSCFIGEELQKMCIKLSPEQISRILQLENVFKDLGPV